MISFVYGLQSAYDSLEVKNSDCLYCVTDTHRVYKGSDLLASDNVEFLEKIPEFAEAESGRVYVVTSGDTAELYIKGTTQMVPFSSSNTEIVEIRISSEEAGNPDQLINLTPEQGLTLTKEGNYSVILKLVVSQSYDENTLDMVQWYPRIMSYENYIYEGQQYHCAVFGYGIGDNVIVSKIPEGEEGGGNWVASLSPSGEYLVRIPTVQLENNKDYYTVSGHRKNSIYDEWLLFRVYDDLAQSGIGPGYYSRPDLPSVKGVKAAIETALTGYDEAFTGVSVAPNSLEGETGVILTFNRKSGESPVEVKIADLFLSAASYDSESHILSLTVKGQEEPVQVDLSDLVGGDVTTDTVKMAKNIVCTVDVGNFKKGQTIDVGSTDTLQKFLVGMLSQDSNPVTKQPSATITLTGAGAIEVGTEFTPKYSASLNPGSYSDNADGSQPTEVTATSYAVSDTSDHSADTQSGQFDPFTVADDTNYKVSVTIQHSAGAVPTTFLGTPYPDGQIQAGSVSASSGSVTGYRQGFYGSLTEKTGEVNSELVRGLSGKTNKKVAKGQKYTISVPTGTMRIVLAYDATVGDVSSITSDEQFGSEIKDSFVKQTVSVLDASGANGKDYNVYVKDLASAQVTGTNYQVTI